MRHLFLLLVLQLSSLLTYAQDNTLSVAEMTAEGNKVYITANHEYTKLHAIHYLKEWGYWRVVEDRKDADFVLQIISKPLMTSEHKAYAVINEPLSGKARYRTGTVNTMGSITFHGRKAVVRRLITLMLRDEIEKVEGKRRDMY